MAFVTARTSQSDQMVAVEGVITMRFKILAALLYAHGLGNDSSNAIYTSMCKLENCLHRIQRYYLM